MKRLLTCLLLISCACLQAAELELELPQPEWLLPPVSPPVLQREGILFPGELETAQQLGRLTGQDSPAALAFVREEYPFLAERLEASDPEGVLRTRVVRGGYDQASSHDQFSAALLYLVGHVYLAQEMHIPAGTAFLTALAALPDYARVHESLGLLYLDTEYYDLAQTHLSRALGLGLDVGAMLADNDGYGYFQALGDLLVTGPTLTNVNDYRVILVE